MAIVKFIYLALLLFVADSIHSQQYLDQTCTWVVMRTSSSMAGFHKKYMTITVDGDSIIQGQTYHKLYEEGIDSITFFGASSAYTVHLPKVLYGLLREDSSKIYSWSGQESLLYDFTRPVGDVISQGTGCIDTIVQIDTVYLGTSALKRWNFAPASEMLPYVEGIGSVTEPFGPRCMIIGAVSTLICYGRNGGQIHFAPSLNCYVYNSVVELQEEALEVRVYPNPSIGMVMIEFEEFEDASYQLFHLNGQLLEQKNINRIKLNLTFQITPMAFTR